MNLRLLFAYLFIGFSSLIYGQTTGTNLLDMSSWTIGNGSVSGYSQNGPANENSREYGTDPYGNSSILWKASPGADGYASGGWSTSYHTIDNTKTYRFSVWLKKTNSHDGNSYLGCNAYSNGTYHIIRLDGSLHTNPYFWIGDLPQLNKWYLVVGFVHGSSYNSITSYGGIYDPETGTKVANTVDFKFASTAANLRHRSFLYYDSNTSDRQYFFDPRIDEVNGNEPHIEKLLGCELNTNMIDTSTWTVGTGSVSGFSQYGTTSENSRVLGKDHVGNDVVLWQASPNSDGGTSGGFASSYININHTKDYRLSVWIKKTNSNDGHSFFKLTSYVGGAHHTLRLNGAIQSWPQFWFGDLPQLNRWYLLVGYIHNSGYASSVNHGKIYDGVTGEVVQSITDYKFKSTATKLQHRAFLYADNNTQDRQYMYAPRMEELNGTEWTIDELLSINPDSKLLFAYDNAGNQTQRYYCPVSNNCQVPPPPTSAPPKNEAPVVATKEEVKEEPDDLLTKEITLFPNPTRGVVSIQLNSNSELSLIHTINIYNSAGMLVRIVPSENKAKKDVDLSGLPSGTYLVHVHLSDGTSVTKQIIKN